MARHFQSIYSTDPRNNRASAPKPSTREALKDCGNGQAHRDDFELLLLWRFLAGFRTNRELRPTDPDLNPV